MPGCAHLHSVTTNEQKSSRKRRLCIRIAGSQPATIHRHHHYHHHFHVADEGRRVVAPPCPRSTARLQRSPIGRVESFRSWSTHLFRGRPGGRRHVRSGGRRPISVSFLLSVREYEEPVAPPEGGSSPSPYGWTSKNKNYVICVCFHCHGTSSYRTTNTEPYKFPMHCSKIMCQLLGDFVLKTPYRPIPHFPLLQNPGGATARSAQ